MASMKQVVNKYAGRVAKMMDQAGRKWAADECWEQNMEGLAGYSEFIEEFHAEMKDASDFAKADRPSRSDRSEMLEAKIIEQREGVQA